jgi:hypothetical protein
MILTRLVFGLVAGVMTNAALAADAFYPPALAQAPTLNIDIPAGDALTVLPTDVGQTYTAAARVQPWSTRSAAKYGFADHLSLDPTPDDAFDGALPVVLLVPLQHDDVQSWFASIELTGAYEAQVELLAGVDSNGDGLPQASELLCRAGGDGYDLPRCFLDLRGKSSQSLWVFARLLGPVGSPDAPSASVRFEVGTADFQLTQNGTRVAAIANQELAVQRSQTFAGPGVQLDFSFHADPRKESQASKEIGGILLTDANGTVATATLWPARLDLAPHARADAPLAIAALSDSLDDVAVTLQPGETNYRVFLDNPGAPAMRVVLVGHGASVLLWKETFPASSVDSSGPQQPPAAGQTGFLIDPDGLPGAPSSYLLCSPHTSEYCSAFDVSAGRYRFAVRNLTDQTITVHLKASVSELNALGPPYAVALYSQARGNYYNPRRSGEGIFFETVGNLQFIYWYTFDAQGDPIWYTAAATPHDSLRGSLNAVLNRVDQVGGQRKATPVGRIILTQASMNSDNTDLLFSWNIGDDYGTNRLALAAADDCAQIGAARLPISGHWFDTSRPGWGTNLVGLGNSTAQGLYFYDASGAPRWVFGAYSNEGGNYAGTLYQTQGACPTCAYPPGGSIATIVGNAKLAFFNDGLNDGVGTISAIATLTGNLHGMFRATTEFFSRATDLNACLAH